MGCYILYCSVLMPQLPKVERWLRAWRQLLSQSVAHFTPFSVVPAAYEAMTSFYDIILVKIKQHSLKQALSIIAKASTWTLNAMEGKQQKEIESSFSIAKMQSTPCYGNPAVNFKGRPRLTVSICTTHFRSNDCFNWKVLWKVTHYIERDSNVMAKA